MRLWIEGGGVPQHLRFAVPLARADVRAEGKDGDLMDELRSVARIVGALVAIVGVLILGAFAVDAYQARTRRLEGAMRFQGAEPRFEIAAITAKVGLGHCSQTMIEDEDLCDSQDLRLADAEFFAACGQCLPSGVPFTACRRVARAILRREIWDNPCAQ